MFDITLYKNYDSPELISSLFNDSELKKAKNCRIDKYFITENLFCVHAMLCWTHFAISEDRFTVCFYAAPEIGQPKELTLKIETEQKKEWVIIDNKVQYLPTIQVEGTTNYSFSQNVWVSSTKIEIEEGTFQLKNGNFAIGQYGKYKPNLTFISSIPVLQWEDAKKEDFNLPKGNLSVLKGDFFTSKKGTKCFKIKKNGSHILIEDRWGGCFCSYRGGTLPQEELYYRRASSNGGGAGHDYAIVPVGWQYTMSEEDI